MAAVSRYMGKRPKNLPLGGAIVLLDVNSGVAGGLGDKLTGLAVHHQRDSFIHNQTFKQKLKKSLGKF